MSNEAEKSTWGTQPGSGRSIEYSRGDFYCRSTNKYNHHESLRAFPGGTRAETGLPEIIAVPPDLVSAINEAVDSFHTPYRTQHDFIRDAAVHRLHDLDEALLDHSLTCPQMRRRLTSP